MKLLSAVLIACVVAANAYNFSVKEVQAFEECQSKYNISKVTDPVILKKIDRCFGACVLTKLGWFNKYGNPTKILGEAFPKVKDKQPILDTFDTCVSENKNSEFCEQVMNILDCINKKIKDKI